MTDLMQFVGVAAMLGNPCGLILLAAAIFAVITLVALVAAGVAAVVDP